MNASSDQRERRRRFDSLVTVYHADMFRYAVWLCRDRSIAEDVVQEALLRAWKSLDALRDEDAAKHWLLTIVRRENARYFERKRLETVDVDDLSPAQQALIAETDNAQLNELREAIYRLEDDYREPLVLQVLMGYTTTEIAELMGLKQGAILTRLHRARHKLKEVYEEDAADAAG